MEYRSRNYVVDDWRGYHCVRTGGDQVLVAIATGIILQRRLGN